MTKVTTEKYESYDLVVPEHVKSKNDKDDPECLALYREAMKEQPGTRTDLCDNITEVEPQKTGNSKAYTCERLSKVAPELFEEVKAGRMSANAAAIQAGKLATLKVGDNQHSKEGVQICTPSLEQAASMLNVGTTGEVDNLHRVKSCFHIG